VSEVLALVESWYKNSHRSVDWSFIH